MSEQRYTDEEIKQRFEMAEAYQDKLEEQLLKDCPADIVDNFRVGEDRGLFRVLLIAPGMELEDGTWHVQSSPEVDDALGIAPAELCLECGPPVGCKYRVRVRTESPTPEKLVEDPMHALEEPESWDEIENWARALVAMGVVSGGNESP